MKFALSSLGVVVIILVVGKTLAGKDEDFEKVRIPCMEENDISEDELKALKEKREMEGVDTKYKCFAHCVAKKMDYLDGDGKFDLDKLAKDPEMSDDVMAKVMECRAEHDKEVDPCEYIYLMSTCVMGRMLKELEAE